MCQTEKLIIYERKGTVKNLFRMAVNNNPYLKLFSYGESNKKIRSMQFHHLHIRVLKESYYYFVDTVS